MKLYLNFFFLKINFWIELGRPIWRSIRPDSPGRKGSRERRRGRGVKEREEEEEGVGVGRVGIGLKTDQPEDLVAACLEPLSIETQPPSLTSETPRRQSTWKGRVNDHSSLALTVLKKLGPVEKMDCKDVRKDAY